jgi:GH25 family lysozyme M1 (1,4-beta-N-acetylmuramidase)
VTYKGPLRLKLGATAWEVQGIDISKWNGSMNFAITKTKCQYVYVRAGYGNGWRDPSLDTFIAGLKANDMPFGLYWFMNIGEDPVRHADGLVEEYLKHSPKLGVVLDAERSTLGPQQSLDWIKAVDSRVIARTNKKGKVYTSMGFWNTGVARSGYWATRELWDANWTTRDYPTIPFDWNGWIDWQHSANGNGKGAEYGSTNGDQDMDLNRFNGTCAQFNAKYDTHIVPIGVPQPPPPEPPPPPIPPPLIPPYVIIGNLAHPISELSIRQAPSLNSVVIGHALKDTKWYPLEEVTGGGIVWYRFAKDAYMSKAYTRYP